eukprot:1909043-Prymnesium_polylepis.1
MTAPPSPSQLVLTIELPFISATSPPVTKMVPPPPPEVALTTELLISTRALPVFIVTAPPFVEDWPCAS